MLKKWPFIAGAFAISAIAWWLFFDLRPPPGVEPKGDEALTIAWISLAVAVLTLLTAGLGLLQKLLELRALQQSK